MAKNKDLAQRKADDTATAFKVEDHHTTPVMVVIVPGPYKRATGWE